MKNARRSSHAWLALAAALFIILALGAGQHNLAAQEQEPEAQREDLTPSMRALLADKEPAQDLSALSATPCSGGTAGGYPCHNVDLLAFMPLSTFNATDGNDSWGWTDPLNGKEYALMGLNNGTAFVDISDPENPLYLGKLPTHSANSPWRDIKVYDNHAFIVSEAGSHGMQVFDLTELRNVVNPPVTFSETAHYSQFGSAHNIVINEDSGYAYAVGGACSGGLHMINIQTPASPTFAGCFSSDGYTHDAQCINYAGPDPDHQGAEICFNSNEDTLTIVDVTDKSNPVQLSRTGYSGSGYTHQGWITDDHTYFLLDDELDEWSSGHNTRTYMWDVSDLDNPSLIDHHDGSTPAIDHNQYVVGDYTYQANYRAGLRILDISDVANGNLSEKAYFDIFPGSDGVGFEGAWNVYPFFESGVVLISGIEQGLFIVDPTLAQTSYDFTLSRSTSRTGVPGQDVLHTYALANVGLTDSYSLTVSGASWPTTLLNTSPISVSGGLTATVNVSATIPAGAPAGTSDTFTLQVTSVNDPGRVITRTGTTTADQVAALAMTAPITGQTGPVSTTVTYTVAITNQGNATDTFTLTLDGAAWPTTVSTSTLTLASQASQAAEIAVIVGTGASDAMDVTATSTYDGNVSATITLTTTNGYERKLYLPLTLKN